jgi:Transcription factor WhiB
MGTIDNKVIDALNRVSACGLAARRANGLSWRLAAACRSADPELFFPLSGSGQALEQIAEAKAICAGCPVRRQCLEFALGTALADACLDERPRPMADHADRLAASADASPTSRSTAKVADG